MRKGESQGWIKAGLGRRTNELTLKAHFRRQKPPDIGSRLSDQRHGQGKGRIL